MVSLMIWYARDMHTCAEMVVVTEELLELGFDWASSIAEDTASAAITKELTAGADQRCSHCCM